jgi:hypothetical protein
MAEPFATTDDLEQRWRPLDSDEETRAAVLLGDAAVRIRVACPGIDAKIAATPPAMPELDPDVPKIISCEMVKRAMLSPVDQPPMSQTQETVGPFSRGGTYVNPTGDLYLTKAEKQMLGCGGQQAFTVPMRSESATAHAPTCSLYFGATYCSCGADIAGFPLYGVG